MKPFAAWPFLADLRRWSWQVRAKSVEAHLQLRAAIAEDLPIVTDDGGLMTMLRLDGCRLVGQEAQLEHLAASLAARLAASLREPGHALHLVFERDPEAGQLEAARALEGPLAGARRLGLDLGDLLMDRQQALARHLVSEHCHIALWTRAAALPPAEYRLSVAAIRQRCRQLDNRLQRPAAYHEELVPRHTALVGDLLEAGRNLGLQIRPLEASAALGVIQAMLAGRTVEPDLPAHGLVPAPGTAPFRIRSNGAASLDWRYPALAPCLIETAPEISGGFLQLAGRCHAALAVMLGPRNRRPFTELLCGLADIPFRQSLLIESGAWKAAVLKQMTASVLAAASHVSRQIRDQIENLQALDAEGVPIVRLSMLYQTWGTSPAEARRRRDILRQRTGAWGDQAVSAMTGDPVESWAATIPGLGAFTTAPRALCPLADALALAPLQRPAIVAGAGGGAVMAGHAGKPLSWPVLSRGEHGFDLVFGEPGKGKSVLLNSRALATVLTAGHDRLPLIAILDIGSSARGLVSALQAALPPSRRGEVVFHRLTNSRTDAMNPFDTPVGCRYPPAHQVTFLHNLIAAMIRPADAETVPAGLDTLIPGVIVEAYRMRDDGITTGQPNLYEPGILPEVDAALNDAGRSGAETTWWAVCDQLLADGRTGLAASAQRQAVPVLGDLPRAAQATALQGSHGSIRLASSEAPAEALVRMLGAVQRNHAALAGRSALNLGHARIAVLDLAELADPHDARRTAIIYLAARQALTGDWFITPDDVARMPETVRSLHAERVRMLLETEKLLQYDEFHRTGSIPELVAQVGLDVREGRKHRRRVVLASQRLVDFDAALVALASTVWILGADGAGTRAEIIRTFDLDDSAAAILRHGLPGPGPDGAPVLVLGRDAKGALQQHARSIAGPVELWALTTTPHDAALRDRLYARLDPATARRALAARFPVGSIGPHYVASRSEHGAASVVDETRILDELAEEIAAAARQEQRQSITTALAEARSSDPSPQIPDNRSQ